METPRKGPEPRTAARIPPRRARAARRDEAVIQAEIRRLALAPRHPATWRLDTPRRDAHPDLDSAA